VPDEAPTRARSKDKVRRWDSTSTPHDRRNDYDSRALLFVRQFDVESTDGALPSNAPLLAASNQARSSPEMTRSPSRR